MPVQAIKKQSNKYEDPTTIKAKAFPIVKLYNGDLRKSGQVLLGKCPLHKDDSPSFAIYFEKNTWNCFAGCGGGDTIDLYMKLNNVDFKTAIKRLIE